MFVPYHPPRSEHTEAPGGPGLEQVFARADDFQRRTLHLPGGGEAALYWLEGMVRTERLNDYVLRPLATLSLGDDPVTAALEGGIWAGTVLRPATLQEAADGLTDGGCAVALAGALLLVPVPTEEKRGVEMPEDEPTVKGANDAFVEAIRTNTSLVRRRLKTCRLAVASSTVGRESRTTVDVLWVEGLTNPALAQSVLERVQGLDVDALLAAEPLAGAITDTHSTMFPTFVSTQRPDRFCQGLMNGMVGVFCDGIAQGLLLPGTVSMFLRTPADQNNQWLVARLLAGVRYLCLGVSLLLPALYIAAAAFHFGLMPAAMAESISASRQSVPISPPLEVLLLLLAFEILQEAGSRMPRFTGQNVSIIGSLVVGQAAVTAKLFSPVVVVVVSAAGIAGYTLPNNDLANALRAVRFALSVLSALAGVFGIALGLAWLCLHLAQVEGLGVSWLAPFAPDAEKGPSAATRVPVRRAKLREVFLHPREVRNQR
ncbi:MAG: spore germination protein [Oscillospiraceae bacterium]|nr:spore germination protein [Oscillospiraceae bacterium]